MQRLTTFTGIAGFAAVAFGAFGAHGLEGRLSPEGEDWWTTATLYALVHAAAALAIALAPQHSPAPRKAGWAFLIGIVIFSGSLYAMALGAPRILGTLTPIGGVSFLTGWALVVWHGAQRS
ncbi:UPF0382 membrane protein SERP0230 [Durusdinium trenchii]|uniref:UPF0382 membrane protein SERP0230 n=1 Tax=Durusdinium trenchii TaxID=1381693 RepID=A0ABP0LSQ7_9DINO